jgi:hypothetical protein
VLFGIGIPRGIQSGNGRDPETGRH